MSDKIVVVVHEYPQGISFTPVAVCEEGDSVADGWDNDALEQINALDFVTSSIVKEDNELYVEMTQEGFEDPRKGEQEVLMDILLRALNELSAHIEFQVCTCNQPRSSSAFMNFGPMSSSTGGFR